MNISTAIFSLFVVAYFHAALGDTLKDTQVTVDTITSLEERETDDVNEHSPNTSLAHGRKLRGSACTNWNQHCGYWARNGECAKSPQYMSRYCKKSCGKCNDGSTRHEIRSQLDSSYCLDVPGGRARNFARLQLYRCNGSTAQKFTFDRNGRLRSALNHSYCVEMDPDRGVFLHTACYDSWKVTSTHRSGPFIKNIGENKCLAVERGGHAYGVRNGMRIVQGYCDTDYAPNSEFTLH